MKNREKYRDEIIKATTNEKSCEFMLNTVIPQFIDSRTNADILCESGDCAGCSMMFAFWIDEEYVEPPKPEVDWDKVPVDTLVRVRDGEYEKWRLRYFSGFFEYDSLKYETWNGGKTSKTADGTDDSTTWRYCELVEEDDEE